MESLAPSQLSVGTLDHCAVHERLRLLNIALPTPPAPLGCYKAVMIRNGLGAVSGQFPFVGKELLHRGIIGLDLSESDGYAAARVTALNVISQIGDALDGFHRFAGLLRLEGYIASSPGFVSQPKVLDGASELFLSAFGESLGGHSRAAYSVTQLPFGASVELVVTFAVAVDK